MDRKRGTLNKVLLLLVAVAILAGLAPAQRVNAFSSANLFVKGLTAAGMAKTDPEAAMNYIKECNTLHPGAIASEEIEYILDNGYLTGYVDELKSLGYISTGYTLPDSSSSASAQTEPSAEPEPFTVEDMEDTPMWATAFVNYRDGASTDYNRLGRLEQYEQVIVNGVASTGWYRFNTADGTVAYVLNSYLTTEDLGNRELNTDNAETGRINTFVFWDTDSEAAYKVTKDIKEEYAEKEPVVEEPEAEIEEEVVEEPEPVTEELPVERVEEEEESAHSWLYYVSIVFAVVCVIIIIICRYYIIRNKKRGRVD